MSDPAEKKSRTPRLDESLRERFRSDPRRFAASTTANLLVGIFLLVVAGILSYFAVKVVGFAYGGDALLLMVITFLLIAVAILHDVLWRFTLMKTGIVLPSAKPAEGGKAP